MVSVCPENMGGSPHPHPPVHHTCTTYANPRLKAPNRIKARQHVKCLNWQVAGAGIKYPFTTATQALPRWT